MKLHLINSMSRPSSFLSSLRSIPNSVFAVRNLMLMAGPVGAILLLLSGCGPTHPATYPVTGKAQFEDGELVTMGFIELRSKTSPPIIARGKIESDGSFKVGTYSSSDGAVPGEHDAIVIQVLSPPLLHGSQVKHERDHGAAVDAKHGDFSTSGLSISVRADGPNSPTLTLTRAKQQPVRHHSALPVKAHEKHESSQ